MGLVEYSDSEGSDNESQAKPQPASVPASKQNFRKVVDRQNPHKIRVNLPTNSSTKSDEPEETERPAKKLRTGAAGRFSGIGSFLPAPKRSGDAAGGGASKRVGLGRGLGSGINLKTGATPAFTREPVLHEPSMNDGTSEDAITLSDSPAVGAVSGESESKEPEVKLIGKATVFRPLSVARNSQKKKKKPVTSLPSTTAQTSTASAHKVTAAVQEPPSKPKVSLFSMSQQNEAPVEQTGANKYIDEADADNIADDIIESETVDPVAPDVYISQGPQTLDTIASQMNLDEAARRQLFGRRGKGGDMPINLVNFDTDQEYAHNEELRASGETIQHNPLRSIQPGKHSLRQLVSAASTQKDALEESWAAGRRNKKEAGNKYGW